MNDTHHPQGTEAGGNPQKTLGEGENQQQRGESAQNQDGAEKKEGSDNETSKNGEAEMDLEDTPEVKLARVELMRDRERRENETMRAQAEAQIAAQKQQLEALKEVARDVFGNDDQEALKKIVEQRRMEHMKEKHGQVLDLLPSIREQRNVASSSEDREMLDQIISSFEMFVQAKPEIVKDPNKAHQIMQVVQLLGNQKAYSDGLISKEKERATMAQQECDNLTNKLLTEQSRRSMLEKELEITKAAVDYMRQSADPDQLRQHENMASSLLTTLASKNAPTPTSSSAPSRAEDTAAPRTDPPQTWRSNNPLENLCSLLGQKRTRASATAPSLSAYGNQYYGNSAEGGEPSRRVRQKTAPASSAASSSTPSSGVDYYTSPFDIRGITSMDGSGDLARRLRNGGMTETMSSDIHSVFGNPLYDQFEQQSGSSSMGVAYM